MRKVTMITIMLSLALSACGGGTAIQSSGISTNQPVSGQTQTPKIHPELFVDRDTLLEVAQKTNDYRTIEYAAEQLQKFKDDQQYKDYKNVLKKFVTEELKSEVNTFQTITLENHSRSVLVTTKDEKAYKMCMELKDGIWLVECYADIEWITYPID